MTAPTLITLPETLELKALDWTVAAVCDDPAMGTFEWDEDDDMEMADDGSYTAIGRGRDCWCGGWIRVTAALPDGQNIFFEFPWIATGKTHAYTAMWDFDIAFNGDEQMWGNLGVFPRNFVTVDEDGDELDMLVILEDLAKHTIVWESGVRDILPSAPDSEDMDTGGKDTAMPMFTIERDDARDLRFSGELVAEASSWSSNNDQRWTELSLYETAGGKYVAVQIGHTRWVNEHTRHAAQVCDDAAAVCAYLGAGRLAKEIYAEAGITFVEVVD